MKKELTDQLVSEYPEIFSLIKDKERRIPIAFFRIETRDGWYDLIKQACESIKHTSAKFVQVKEKFGGLRIYFEIDSNDPNSDMVRMVLTQVEEDSFEICEVCGKPGHRRPRQYVQTLCEECNEKIGGSK